MSRPSTSRRQLAASLLALAALVAACGGQTSPTVSAAGASGDAPSGAASGATSGDQLLDVRIGAPYTLVDLPAAQGDAIQAGIEKNLGAYGKAVHVNVKAIQQQGASAAYLMVVAFPRGTLNDDIYSQVITDLSMGAEADFTPKLISNVPVSFGSMNGGSVAVFREGDLVLITLAVKATDLTPIATALVTANG
jgi:hypothetical protein